MKKKRFTVVEGLLILMLVFMLAVPAFAGFGNVISSTTLNSATTGASGVIGYGKQNKGTFFITTTGANPSLSGTGPQNTVKMEGSYDNGNWSTLYFYDSQIGSASTSPVSSKNMVVPSGTASSSYIFFADPTLVVPYIRINVTAPIPSNTQANTVAVNFYSNEVTQ